MTYIEPDIGDDESTILADITTKLETAFPGWLPVRGGLIYVLASGFAFVVAELYGVMRLMTRSIFTVFLREVSGIARVDAAPSTAVSTWTSNTLSFTVEAGTVVGIDDGAGGLVAFEVVADVSTTDGSAENVQLVSQEAGAFTAGLTGPVVMVDAVGYAPSVVLTGGATVGGTDGETDDEYRSRGSERLQLSSDDVINGQDAAVLARQTVGVHRALAVDNYDLVTSNPAAAGHITVALQAESGGAVSAPVKAAALAEVQAATVMGITVHAVDVVTDPVKVTFSAVAYREFDAADVESRAEAAVAEYLASAAWGALPFGDTRTWRQSLTVRYLEVAEALNRVEGVDYITSLQIARQPDSLGTVDVSLGSLPWTVAAPGTITGTVTAGA